MFRLVKLCIGTLVRLFRWRQGLLLENLALRQQLTVLKGRNPRPGLGNFDRLFWVVARRLWSGWKQSLVLVTRKQSSVGTGPRFACIGSWFLGPLGRLDDDRPPRKWNGEGMGRCFIMRERTITADIVQGISAGGGLSDRQWAVI